MNGPRLRRIESQVPRDERDVTERTIMAFCDLMSEGQRTELFRRIAIGRAGRPGATVPDDDTAKLAIVAIIAALSAQERHDIHTRAALARARRFEVARLAGATS